jgi:plastocyanin
MGSTGTGATHTVYVAPTQGVLRYVPFAVNASVGDTVQFMWGANNHTVTKSSELQLCNKTSDAPFASGEQNKGFSFTQVVNSTDPTFFYCGTPGHCEKGMFGIINPPNANGASSSVSQMMPSMMSNDSSMSAMGSYMSSMTSNNTAAANWGSSMDMSAIPSWAQSYFAENVMYTRTFLAANPETLNSDGSVSLSNLGSNPAMIPTDMSQALNNAASSSSAAPAATSSAAAKSSATPAGAAKTSGARALGSSGALVGVVAVLATFLAL